MPTTKHVVSEPMRSGFSIAGSRKLGPMPWNQFRVTCSCGWTEKAYDERTARARGERHVRLTHLGRV